MLSVFGKKLRCLCSRIRWLIWRRPKTKVIIRKFGRLNFKPQPRGELGIRRSPIHQNGQLSHSSTQRPIRVATFNAAMFSLAPAVPNAENEEDENHFTWKTSVGSVSDGPKSILKQSPLHPALNTDVQLPKEKKQLKVRINLPDNEISLAHSKLLSSADDDNEEWSTKSRISRNRNSSNIIMRSPVCLPLNMISSMFSETMRSNRSVLEVLREVDADILALQDVKAVEEKGMTPLSDLAKALGMNYVFAESWAPEYGNAVLSKWPIKRWKVQKIVDDDDFRNVLKATIDVPWTGEVNFHCTQLDHLDENWRMKQLSAILKSGDSPHILAGGLNSLNESDYSSNRWADIVEYYEDIGKPTPRVQVMKLLKGLEYTDAKEFAGECEPVVMIAKGQNVQGTCKYGTRVDYILASPYSPYKFVPGSYSVISSKGTSDHHIVKAEIIKVRASNFIKRQLRPKQKIVKITNPYSSKGIWQLGT